MKTPATKSLCTPIPLLVALDFKTASEAKQLASQLDPTTCRLKIGKQLFTYEGPALVQELQQMGFDIFLDLKFHDIPATVAKAVVAAAELGVWMVNIHASGGPKMMTAAREALDALGLKKPPLLIGVTVLTSIDDAELAAAGIDRSVAEQVDFLASSAKECGLDGVVCSAQEAVRLKSQLGEEFVLVTPGIRPVGSQQNDQSRVMTPIEAVANGSDYLVVGRPITASNNPPAMVEQINRELDSAE